MKNYMVPQIASYASDHCRHPVPAISINSPTAHSAVKKKMKRWLVIPAALIGLLAECGMAQTTKTGCSSACGHPTPSLPKASYSTHMETTMENKVQPVTIACKLTSPQLQQRKQTVIASLNKQVLEKKELGNGYAYRFEATDQVLDELTDFIKTERQCCDFFNFSLSIQNEGSTWLELTGPEGAKDFIEAEIQLAPLK